MSEEAIPPQPQPRRRSNSLPIPHIEISVYQGPGTNSRDSPTGSSITKDFIEIPDQPVSTLVTGNMFSAPKLCKPLTIKKSLTTPIPINVLGTAFPPAETAVLIYDVASLAAIDFFLFI